MTAADSTIKIQEKVYDIEYNFTTNLKVYEKLDIQQQDAMGTNYFLDILDHFDYNQHNRPIYKLVNRCLDILRKKPNGEKHDLHDTVMDILVDREGKFPESFYIQHCSN
jgi:hypothetical protein